MNKTLEGSFFVVRWLAVLVGFGMFACIPVAIFIVIKGFLYDPMGWIKLGFAGFIWVYFLAGFFDMLSGGRS